MSNRQETRAGVSALLGSGKTVKEIVANVKCGRTLVYVALKKTG